MSTPTPPFGTSMCQRCGTDVSYLTSQSTQRTHELESQVRLLTDKATAAADKLADYEDELRRLKTSSPHPEPTADPPSRPPSALQSRLSALLPSAKRPPSQPSTPGAFPTPEASDLEVALKHETALRHAAEERFVKAQEEMEELSAQLFAEANEMVAGERRERRRLEEEVEEGKRVGEERRGLVERIEGLEKRVGEREGRVEVLERRAREKEGRWEELERRVRRGERVRGLLAEAGG